MNISDIDECLEEGGRYGHHCHKDQQCENTIGSYNCTCLSGHVISDDHSCASLSRASVAYVPVTSVIKCSISVIAAWLCLLVLELIPR